MQAMILAAGFGSRLLPYTKYKPKPLFPILNTPLLVLTLDRLKESGFDHIIVNCHHLKEQVKEVLAEHRVIVQEENEILGTGGGLRMAFDQLRDEPLLVINGDIYHTLDCKKLYRQHQQSSAEVTLAVHDYPRFNTLLVDNGRLMQFADNTTGGNMAFTGVHVLNPGILEPIAPEKKSCIIKRYSSLLQDNPDSFKLVRVDNCFWTDMGTPTDYLNLHCDILLNNVPLWSQLHGLADSPLYVDRQCSYGRNVKFKDWVSVGRCIIGDNVTVSRSVIWDGAVVPPDSLIEDTIFI